MKKTNAKESTCPKETYFGAIKSITWPKGKNVMTFFFVVLIVIILLTLILGAMDALITFIISYLYA